MPTATRSDTASPSSTSRRVAASLLAVEGVLLFVPLAVLGSAIGWPASLADPAAVALPRLLENEGAVRLGYLVYLAYSVLFLPVAIWTTRTLTRGDDGPLARMAVAFAVASTLARCIGILRWLTAMPALAMTYVAAPEGAPRDALAAVYDALNDFGGGIGELLGVSLFAAGWLGCTVVTARRAGGAPGWLLGAGTLAAVALTLPLVELLGVDPGGLTAIGTSLLQLWFLAAAVVLARAPRGV
jgi:Domain of unknown function (DUF4386)